MTAQEQNNKLGLELSIQRFPSETALATAYILLAGEGLLSLLYHHRTPPTLSEFLAEAKAHDRIHYCCFAKEIGTDAIEIAGLGFATKLMPLGEGAGFRANVGQAFRKKFWARDVAKELAILCVDDGFEKCGIDVMYGYTPVANPAAVRFITKLGFHKLCVAPKYDVFNGAPCDVVISCVTKEQWNRATGRGPTCVPSQPCE